MLHREASKRSIHEKASSASPNSTTQISLRHLSWLNKPKDLLTHLLDECFRMTDLNVAGSLLPNTILRRETFHGLIFMGPSSSAPRSWKGATTGRRLLNPATWCTPTSVMDAWVLALPPDVLRRNLQQSSSVKLQTTSYNVQYLVAS